jgi:hypothetical protein
MQNTESDSVLDIARAQGGGDFDFQTYRVGTGGLTRVNIQPRLGISYDTTPTPFGVFTGLISGLLVAGIGTFILMVLFGVVIAIRTGDISDTLIGTCFHIWLVITVLGGVAGFLINLLSD